MMKRTLLKENEKLQKKVKSLTKALLDSYEELELLYDLGTIVSSGFGLEAVASMILEKVVVLIGACKGELLVLDTEKGELITVASYTDVLPNTGISKMAEREITQQIFSKVLKDERTKVYKKTYADRPLSPPRICVALKVKDGMRGILYIIGKTNGTTYTSMDQKLLSAVAPQIAIIIESAKLYSGMRQKIGDLLARE